jgi:hypothetical protein
MPSSTRHSLQFHGFLSCRGESETHLAITVTVKGEKANHNIIVLGFTDSTITIGPQLDSHGVLLQVVFKQPSSVQGSET